MVGQTVEAFSRQRTRLDYMGSFRLTLGEFLWETDEEDSADVKLIVAVQGLSQELQLA